jgi:3-hydroxyacyl-[acyl-carrier-protein] dehydratase
MRYFLIDKVTELTVGERIRGVKNVTLSDEILHDHFPDYPILPGALIVEAAAQLAGYLLEATLNRAGAPVVRALLVQIQQAKFYDTVGPGDQLALEATIGSRLEDAVQVTVEGRAGERRIVRGTLTFVMKAIDSERIHEQRRYLYRLWTRELNPPPPIP